MKASPLVPAAALCALLAPAPVSAAGAPIAPRYEISLDDREALVVRMSIYVPAGTATLIAPPASEDALLRSPSCGDRPLVRKRTGVWRVPSECDRVSWSASIQRIDASKFDVAGPPSVWDPKTRLWLLTGSLPWLRMPNQQGASARIGARVGRSQFHQAAILPPPNFPLAIVVGSPLRNFVADGFTVQGFGYLPSKEADPWQDRLASILAAWRRDLLPSDAGFPAKLNYVWLPAPAGAEPGLQASANSGSILMQYVPDRRDAGAGPRLKVGILVVGAHEGFHALGSVRGAPAWVAESLATYFAYRAARQYLDPISLALAKEFVNARAERSLLNLQQAFDAGDGSAYPSFYGKGARLWSAIERVLTTPANSSGKLAALIRQTRGLEGMDWSDGERIAAYLDRYSEGRAGAVVRCFLVEDKCPSDLEDI
jgi:hypothetical protein